MLRVSPTLLVGGAKSSSRMRRRPSQFEFRGLTRYQRQALGHTKWDLSMSQRRQPTKERFNPVFAGNTKGQTGEEWKWWHYHRRFLPQVAPEGYEAPTPVGRAAWPSTWDDEFAAGALALTDAEVKEAAMDMLAEAIFEETQRDGYELRRLDFEGKPLTEMPTRDIIEKFVLEERTIRDRVIKHVVEDGFRFVPTSEQRSQMKSTQNILEFLVARMTTCRMPADTTVPDTVKEVLATCPLQPEFGFKHALPRETREPLLVEWERLFQHDWQFGNAVYTPRSKENPQGNLVWLRMSEENAQREAHAARVQSGEAREEHMRTVQEAMAESDV